MGQEIDFDQGHGDIRTMTGLNYGLEYVERKLADKVGYVSRSGIEVPDRECAGNHCAQDRIGQYHLVRNQK